MNNAMNGWGGVTLAYPPAPATPILRDGTSGHGKQWFQPKGLPQSAGTSAPARDHRRYGNYPLARLFTWRRVWRHAMIIPKAAHPIYSKVEANDIHSRMANIAV